MKRILFFTTVFLVQAFVFAQIPTGSLVGYWPFNGNASDLSGNSNNGAVNGASLTTDRFGNCNNAYSFDGVSNNIIVPNSVSIDMNNSTNFSVAFWMKTYPGASFPLTTLCKNQYGYLSGYEFFSNSSFCGTPGFVTFYTAGSYGCTSDAICTGTNQGNWFFITGIYNGGTQSGTLYVNAVQQATTDFPPGYISSQVDLYFGSQTNNTEFFDGALDDIRIYKRLLSQPEIMALYNESNPLINTTPAANQTVCAGNSASLSATCGTNTINWYSSPTSTVPVVTGTSCITPTLPAGNYTYYVRAGNCSEPAAQALAVTFTVSNCTGIRSYLENKPAINIYPNPSHDRVTIEASASATLVLYNIYGQQLISQNLERGANSVSISEFAKGIYFAEIKCDNTLQLFKIVRD